MQVPTVVRNQKLKLKKLVNDVLREKAGALRTSVIKI